MNNDGGCIFHLVDGSAAAHGWQISATEGSLGARFEIRDVIIQ